MFATYRGVIEMRLLRRKDVLDRCAISASTLQRLMQAGQFPTPIMIASRRVAWLEHEVEAWIAARISEARVG